MTKENSEKADSPGPDRFAFSAFIDALPDAIVIVGPDGLIVEINMKAVGLFGYARDELVGEPVGTLIPDRFRNSHVELQGRYNRSPHVRPMGPGTTLYARHKDGHDIPVAIHLGPFQSADGPMVISTVRPLGQVSG
jgi:PAS domain S-box-containing protein